MNRQVKEIELLAPLTGPVVPIEDVPDPVFAGKMFGDGIGLDPLDTLLVAPCDGTISHLARTGHAVTLTTEEGAEVLLHVGIDTVELKGEGFTPKVQQGDRVVAGQSLIEFDPDYVARRAHSLVTVVAIANGDAFQIASRASGSMQAGRTRLLTLVPTGQPVMSPSASDAERAEAAAQAVGATAAAAGAAAAIVADASPSVEARGEVQLATKGGLHARPAARARDAARKFASKVELHYGGKSASLNSIVGLLGLGAGEGASVTVVAIGHDAREALEAVIAELGHDAPDENEQPSPAHAVSPAPRAAAPVAARALDPNTLAGVAASPGVGVGTLVRWDDGDVTPVERATGTPAAESRALDKALAAVDAELEATVARASQRGAVGEAGIFAVHRVLLDDPALVDAARDLISLGKSAGFAWREAVRAQSAMLGNLEDKLLAERAADLRDIEKRVLRALGLSSPSRTRELPPEAVLCADEFTPSDLAGLDTTRVTGLVTARGGATTHAAIIARQLGIPALVAIGDALHAVPDGTQVVVDANAGRLEYAPTTLDIDRARAERARIASVRDQNRKTSQLAAKTTDGHAVEVAANIATAADARVAVENGADAVGLLRTELMFIHRPTAPSVDAHRDSYQAIVTALEGRTAIIRTLDVGADKEVDYLTLPPEPNPALGLRGIRLAQVRPDLLDDQLRGLVAVQPHGAVRILLPMVTDVGELIRLRARIDQFQREAGRTDPIEVGVMIEVPSAALLADQLARYADFLSIGTNDLTQYTLAMDRMQAQLADQADGLHPAVLRLIAATTQGAAKYGRWVGVCGALAGDPVAVPLLVGLGVTELSVDPVSVPSIKARVRTLDYQLCRQRAQDALALESAQAVRAASREVWPLD
ncbi:phosphoenolpyruvate--protein phosphotransferase [Pararobbsia silviterrae]|uniref:phosphoenolpyruvate--protein phosphotransferase n=1 Tax=Pararobbsia silviterrae TaxID=1792498 RepID=A0A494YAP1_9BURK|nr:phosphoenolpyruvate--protein phosphotransferase [Pararobbsia silviterrae]RKP58810.1 phosphoenolpyruvate--protein phosphotransferase [Pararobbsia silviterrae]